MDSIIKFGQFVKHQRRQKGMTQKELSMKVFNKTNQEYIGRLERGTLNGITFATVDRILLVLDAKMQFEQEKAYVSELHRR